MKEELPGKISRRSFTRNAVLALGGTSLFLGGLKKLGNLDESRKLDIERMTHALFKERKILPNNGEAFLGKMNVWYRRYSGQDAEYNNQDLHFRKGHKLPEKTINEELKTAWERLLAGDLKIVYDATRKKDVPFDLIFLALAESHWKTGVKASDGGAGPWQFMPKTGEQFGLVEFEPSAASDKDKKTSEAKIIRDDRFDVKKSTEAACEYLKSLHKKAEKCAKDLEIEVSDSDLWLWAFWAYNHGEGNVFGIENEDKTKVKIGIFSKAKGDPNKYSEFCDNVLSVNYAPKILGLAQALEEIVAKRNYEHYGK